MTMLHTHRRAFWRLTALKISLISYIIVWESNEERRAALFSLEICQIWNRCYCLPEAGVRFASSAISVSAAVTNSTRGPHQYSDLTLCEHRGTCEDCEDILQQRGEKIAGIIPAAGPMRWDIFIWAKILFIIFIPACLCNRYLQLSKSLSESKDCLVVDLISESYNKVQD